MGAHFPVCCPVCCPAGGNSGEKSGRRALFVTELTLVFPEGPCYDAPEEGENQQTGAKEVDPMRNRKGEIAAALALLTAASALCLKLMKAAGDWLDREQRKLDETEDEGE